MPTMVRRRLRPPSGVNELGQDNAAIEARRQQAAERLARGQAAAQMLASGQSGVRDQGRNSAAAAQPGQQDPRSGGAVGIPSRVGRTGGGRPLLAGFQGVTPGRPYVERPRMPDEPTSTAQMNPNAALARQRLELQASDQAKRLQDQQRGSLAERVAGGQRGQRRRRMRPATVGY